MIPINSLQELSRSPLPCDHSPSRSKLRHPLLCYTVPWVIHLALPRISHTWIILETSSRLTVEESLRLALPRRPSNLCYLNTTYFRRSWLTMGFSCLKNGLFHAFHLDNFYLSFLDRSFLLTCITSIKKFMSIIINFKFKIFSANLPPIDFPVPYLFSDLFCKELDTQAWEFLPHSILAH